MGITFAVFISSGTVPFVIDLLINIEIGSAMLRPICFRIIEVILSLLQELLALSDLITFNVSSGSVGVRKKVLLFLVLCSLR